MSLLIDDPMDDAALSVILDAVNSREPTGLTVHAGCAQAYLEGRTLHGDVCDPCFADLDWIAADDGYRRRCDR